jgi:hypothetical protein
MKKVIVLAVFLAVMITSAGLMMEGCEGKIATLAAIVVTATETATPIPATQVSDFQSFGIGSNGTGVIINPTLVNYVSGSAGFTTYVNPSAPTNGVLNPSAVVQSGYGNGSDTYAARVNATWTDPANATYPAAQMLANLYSGTKWYVIPPGLTGVKFYLNVVTMVSTTAAPAPSFAFQIPLASTVQNNNGGLCSASCYDNFSKSLPTSTAGYVLITVPFSSMARGGFGSSIAPCSQTNVYDGCNNQNVMQLEWTSASNNNSGNYSVDYRVDDVTFY